MKKSIIILGIESSCDDTAAAVVRDGYLLSSIIAGQKVHNSYGGVVPELASRAHQQNIIPVVDAALQAAGIGKNDISAIAFTKGPGLLGSLLVGTSFAKGFALALDLPLIEVNHLQAHILVHFINDRHSEKKIPGFPFLCLLVSGGHTRIVLVRDYLEMETLGSSIDDAAGEAFDKCAKIMGLPYPGGPVIDKKAQDGNDRKFKFAKPKIQGLDFSFSGLKTSFLYFVRDQVALDPDFINLHTNDLCASIQRTIVEVLIDKLVKAVKQTSITNVAVAGGVSANSHLKKELLSVGEKSGWNLFIPDLSLTTDNAAMIAITGFYKYLKGEFCGHDIAPMARYNL